MRKTLATVLVATVILSVSCVAVMAHPKAIEEKTFELQADTIFVVESTTAGSSYTVEYTDPQTSGDDAYKMYPLNHSTQKGGFAVLRVDISSVKQASDFALNFSLITSYTKNSVFCIYCADYEAGKSLFESLEPGEKQTNVAKPAVHNTADDNRIYQYTTVTQKTETITLASNEHTRLKEHVDRAINAGNDSVYFLVAVTKGDYFYLYNSSSSNNAPSLTVTGSAISSEIGKSEAGYTYKVGGLDAYADAVMVVVAAYVSRDNLINVATSGSVTTAEGETTDAFIACPGAVKLKAYILKAETLEPLTFVEEVLLGN